MKEKIWFTFKFGDKHHQGPFAQEEIHLLLQQGKLPEGLILWKEGMKRWKPWDQCLEFASPPEKPDSAPITPKKEPKKKPAKIQTVAPDTPPESFLIRYCLGAATVFLITLLIWPQNVLKKNAPKIYSLGSKERLYLEQVAKIQSNKKPLFRMAIDKKRERLWLASNYKGNGKIFLTLTSNPEKTLSLKKITITSEASFQQGYAQFTHFSLVKGNWPIPGEYQAKIHLYPTNRKHKVIPWKGLFIVPPKENQSLSESLERWKKNVQTHYLSPLKRQYQYYKTLKSQLINMKDFYEKSFQATTWQEFSTLFEQQYNREIGPLLQRFILDGRHLHLSLFNSDAQNSKEYEKIFLYGKEIGALASDIATQTGQGSIKKAEKNLLSRLNKLIAQANSALEELQEKINYYQKELPKD